MLSDQAMRDRMRDGWRMGKPFTVCGNGSSLENTKNIREWLPGIVEKYDFQVVCDAGAGDMAWLPHMDWTGREPVDYQPFDLFPRHSAVTEIDITTQALPVCDAILCRMVLNHLVDVSPKGDRNEDRINMALSLFKQSGDYLIATQFNGPQPARAPQFARLDLRDRLGEPVEWVQDGHEPACKLALWKL